MCLGISGIPISLLKIQWCLLRNGRGPKVPPEQVLRLQRGIVTSTAEQVIFPHGHGEPGGSRGADVGSERDTG